VRLLVNEEIAPTRMRVLLGQPQGEPVQPEGGAAFIVVLDDTGGGIAIDPNDLQTVYAATAQDGLGSP